MKVILVSPYSENLVGGIINWTKHIVHYHRNNGGDIDLTLLYNKNASQVLDSSSSISRLRAGLFNYIPVVRQFKKKINSENFDVAHLCTSASFGLIRDLLITHAAKKKGIKTIVHMHLGRIPQILESKGWERTLLLRLVKEVDCVAVMDRFSFVALQKHGFNKVRFVPNPLSSTVQELIKDTPKCNRDSQKIVFAGHILPTKGVEELVLACKKIDNVQLKLLGKVPNEAYRKQLFTLAGNDSDKWLSISGNQPLENVIAEMKGCGVFVLPSYSEGFPNVILESMACECPIVATTVGAIPEMLAVESDEPCGLCCEPKNVEALRQSILFFLDNPDKANDFGRRAQKRVKEMYSIEKVWEQLVAIWESDNSESNPNNNIGKRL